MTLAGKIISAALFLVGLYSCSNDTGESTVELSFKTSQTDYKASNQFVSVTARGEWTLSLVYEGGVSGWASLSDIQGTGSKKTVVLNWEKNSSPEERILSVVLESAGKTVSREFRQGGTSTVTVSDIKSDPVPQWMELPATNDPKLYFITHSMTIGSTTTRNYSYYWDVDALVAHWVAYHLNSWSMSSGSRSNAWGLDPKLPQSCQPVLYKAYSTSSEFLERGHQCPSADRLQYSANVQTFYGVNMTPQRGELNEKAWSLLEGMVRNWSRQLDTLYVVSGCTLKGSTLYSYDNEGKKVKVPTGYYKALLGYKKNGTLGITASTGGYTAIGFYFDHKAYDSDYKVVMAQSMTISELESKVGEDFFVNLPAKIGSTLAAKVENTPDSWWK